MTSTIPIHSRSSVSPQIKGIFFAVLAATCFAFISPLMKVCYENGGNFLTFLLTRSVVGILFFGTLLKWRQPQTPLLPATFTFISAATFAISVMLQHWSLGYTSVTAVTLIIFLYPLVLAGISTYYGQTPSRWFMLSLFLAFIGLYLALNPTQVTFQPLPMLAALASAIGVAIYLFLLDRILKNTAPLKVNFDIYLSTGIVLLICLLTSSRFETGGLLGTALILASTVLSILGQLALYQAIEIVGSLQASLVLKLEPVLTIGLALAINGESIIFSQLIGGTLILIALFLSALPATKSRIATSVAAMPGV